TVSGGLPMSGNFVDRKYPIKCLDIGQCPPDRCPRPPHFTRTVSDDNSYE
ncbi:12011_t:CDS:1, partial [Racocetra persica]